MRNLIKLVISIYAFTASELSFGANASTIVTTTNPAGALEIIGPDARQITFEGAAFDIVSGYYEGGVGFTSNTGIMYIDYAYSGIYNNVGRSLHNNYTADSFSGLRIDFSFTPTATTDGFGFFFGASDYVWTLNAFTAADVLVDSLTINPVFASNSGDFFGITGNNISYACR